MKAFLASYIDRLARWFRDLLSDNGNQSSMRFILILAWLCVLAVWTFLSIFHRAMQAIDATVLTLLGLPTAGKVVQSHFETRQP